MKAKAGIVTGAGLGIGEGIAEGLVQAGAKLAICACGLPVLEQTAEKLPRCGTEVIVVKADVSLKGDVEDLVDRTLERFGRIDFLFNNAGITRRRPSEDFPEKRWEQVIRVNLKSVFLCSQPVPRVMIKQGGSRIVNTSSLIAVNGGGTLPAYAASKGAWLN